MAARPCACGCGREITGRKSRRYYSDACRKRGERATQSAPLRARGGLESRTQEEPATAIPDVTVTDREPVLCPCGRPLPKLDGPLQVAAYCADCVQDQRCPCYTRPAWGGGATSHGRRQPHDR
jgi:hypothetical protein